MSEDKLSKPEIAKLFALLAVVITVYSVVSHFVLNLFWHLVAKLINKILK